MGGQLGKIPVLAKECIKETAKGVANSALRQESEKNLLKSLGVSVGTTLLVGGGSPDDTPTASIKNAFVETTKALPGTLLKTTVSAGLTSAIYKAPFKETLPIALASNIAQAYASAAGNHLGNKINATRVQEEYQRSIKATLPSQQKTKISQKQPIHKDEPEVRFHIAKPKPQLASKTDNRSLKKASPIHLDQKTKVSSSVQYKSRSGSNRIDSSNVNRRNLQKTTIQPKPEIHNTRGLRSFEDFISDKTTHSSKKFSYPKSVARFTFNPKYFEPLKFETVSQSAPVVYTIDPAQLKTPIVFHSSKTVAESIMDFFIAPAYAEPVYMKLNNQSSHYLLFDIRNNPTFSLSNTHFFNPFQSKLSYRNDLRFIQSWKFSPAKNVVSDYTNGAIKGIYNACQNIIHTFSNPFEVVKNNAILAYDFALGALEISTQSSMDRWSQRAHGIVGLTHRLAEANGPERTSMLVETAGTLFFAKKIFSGGGNLLRLSNEKLVNLVNNNHSKYNQLASSPNLRGNSSNLLFQYNISLKPQIKTPCPAEIYHRFSNLTKRQAAVLGKLPKTDSYTTIKKTELNVTDLATLTAKTGDEFAMFTLGSRRLIIRGDEANIYIKNLIPKLKQEGWTWSAHTHPGITPASLVASGKEGDRAVLKLMNQEQSLILNSTGKRSIFGIQEGIQEHLSTNSIKVKRNTP